MRKLLIATGILALFTGCEVSFKTLTLEDNLPVPKPIVGLGDFTATTIFKNSMNDVWESEFECESVAATAVASEGEQALKVEWDRGGCEWAGFGIGWDAWQPKDLSEIMDKAAVEFKIRSVEGEANIPLIIFLLEDYGGTMCAAVFGSACLESYPLNETWQTARLPLSWFSYKEDGCDVTNIKQMVFELQNSGACLIDDMRIVEYEPFERPASSRITTPSVVKLAPENVLFAESFKNAWGIGEFGCRKYEITQEEAFSGTSSLSLYHPTDEPCDYNRMGASWTSWIAVDFTGKEAFFEAWIKADGSLNDQHLWVGLESYDYQNGAVRIDETHVVREERGWKQVLVPLAGTGVGSETFPAGRVKQLFLETRGTTSVWMDDLRIVAP